MSDDEIYAHLEEMNPDALVADGFESAYVGHTVLGPCGPVRAVYDAYKCIDVLVEDEGMTTVEAMEFLDFNVFGAHMGEHTPIFVWIKKT